MRQILRFTLSAFIVASLYSCSSLFSSKTPVELKQVWASENTLRTPESVLYDPLNNVLYVSNINQSKDPKDGDGFISKLNTKGEVENLYWATGLNNPKGMALHNNVLYVADGNELISISAQTGAILGRHQAEGAQFLNDVEADNEGNIYISDTQQNRIYMFRNGRMTNWVNETKYQGPNGLLWDKGQLMVAFMKSEQLSFQISNTMEFVAITDGLPAADGITKIAEDSYLVSNWNGEIHYISLSGKDVSKRKVLDTKSENMNAADIFYSPETKLLYVPTFRDNRVTAYSVSF